MKSFLKYNLVSGVWTLCILVACLFPGKDLPEVTFKVSDKAIHFGIYLLLSVFTFYGWKKQQTFLSLHSNTLLKIVVLSSSYGFVVEILQHIFTADRRFDLYDALANATGAIAGCILCLFFKPVKN